MRTNVHWGLEGRPEAANIDTTPSLLLSTSNCCAPRAKIKILTSSKFRTEKFSYGFFLKFYAKYAKFCTIRKFPAIT